MDEHRFNMSMRKFLKEVGVTYLNVQPHGPNPLEMIEKVKAWIEKIQKNYTIDINRKLWDLAHRAPTCEMASLWTDRDNNGRVPSERRASAGDGGE